jgi:Trypsin-co-occurring domain 1
MVSAVAEVPLAEGGSVLVDVGEVMDGPVVRGRGGPAALPPVSEPLEHVLAGLGPVRRALPSQLRVLTDSPQEIEVEFSVKLTDEARIVITRAGGEANFRIALKYSRTSDAPPPDGGGGGP